jgi:hypothetical protein
MVRMGRRFEIEVHIPLGSSTSLAAMAAAGVAGVAETVVFQREAAARSNPKAWD